MKKIIFLENRYRKNQLHHFITTLTLVFLCGISSYSQTVEEITIQGHIADGQGSGLIGATVLIQDSDIGTISDFEGNYVINAPSDATLIFSFVGFNSTRIFVNGRTTIDVTLDQNGINLDEVVVVGYGTQRKENLTGSVGSIGVKQIENRPLTSVSTALQGAIPGVFINQSSGQAGRDGVEIRIRGIGTLNNAAPLVLVDGIEAPLDIINPDDVASMTVLKDAASAAIYGSRASNGVVLVTTKKGRFNSGKPILNYNSYVGVSSVTSLPSLVNNSFDYATLKNEARTNFGNPPAHGQEALDYFRDNGPNTDWFDEIFSPATMHQHNLSVSGGNDKTNYRVSMGYLNQDGVDLESGFKRVNTRLNLTTRPLDNFSITTGLSVVRRDRKADSDDVTESQIFEAARANPLFPAYDEMGRIALSNDEISGSTLGGPILNTAGQDFREIGYDLLGNLSLEYEPIENLFVSLTGGANFRYNDQRTFSPTFFVYDFITGEEEVRNAIRSASRSTGDALNTTVILKASYEKTIGNNFFKVLGGFNQEDHSSSVFGASRNGFLSNDVRVLSVGDPSSSNNFEQATTWGLRSYFGRVNYTLSDKYLFEANMRIDGTSRFASDKWGTFPSLSAGWIVSKEDFFPKGGAVQFLKIRGSWGKLGNQIADPNNDFIYARALGLTENYNFGGSIVSGVAQTTLGNPDLKWETTTVTDIGVDIGLFNSVTLTADYFIRDTKDILFAIPISSLTGFSTAIANAAQVKNKGWELGLSYDKAIGDFELSIGGNISYVTSDVVQLNPNIDVGDVDRFISGVRLLERGSPVNALYGLEVEGIFQTEAEIAGAADHSSLNPTFGPGDLRFVDQNNDGVINDQDRTVIGKEIPSWLYGLTLNLKFKNLDFQANLTGTGDYQGYANSELAQPFFNTAGLSSMWADRWTPNNTDTEIPRIYDTDGPSSSVTNSFFVNDRSYLRLNNVQIGFSLPASVLRKNFISKLRIYVSGRNLFTKTDWPWFDPERSTSNGERAQDSYPNLKIFTGGINVTF
ncbi:MAG: TonB-linked SusC/RagA family outer membrane protein [Saprospiraceae bacterium]|jgi:TonB-linked SusC/RagA family outer membrane protein